MGLFALLAAYCNLILAEFVWRYRHSMTSRTFDELVVLCLGKSHSAAVSAQVIVGLLGTLVGFFCVIADLGVPVAQHACLDTASGAGFCSVFKSRGGIILFFAALVVLPLASCSRVHHLRLPSALAVLSVMFVVALVIYRGVCASMRVGASSPSLFVPSAKGVLLASPIAIYALGNHVQSVSIFMDASPTSQQRYHVSVAICYTVAVTLYTLAGVCGAWAFTEETKGNVLVNFALGDTPADTAKALMAIHVALVIAVDTIPLRSSLMAYGRGWQTWWWGGRERVSVGGEEGGGANSSSATNRGESDGSRGAKRRNGEQEEEEEGEGAQFHLCGTPISCSLSLSLQTVVILFATGGLAVFFPQVNLVFGLLGSTLGITCLAGYPALMLLQRASEVEQQQRMEGGKVREEGLLDSGGGGMGHDVEGFTRPLLKEESDFGGGDSRKKEEIPLAAPSSHISLLNSLKTSTPYSLPPHQHPLSAGLGYIPSSAFWLRVHGWGLILVSSIVAAACTWEYILALSS